MPNCLTVRFRTYGLLAVKGGRGSKHAGRRAWTLKS